jgi:hypothetical protein
LDVEIGVPARAAQNLYWLGNGLLTSLAQGSQPLSESYTFGKLIRDEFVQVQARFISSVAGSSHPILQTVRKARLNWGPARRDIAKWCTVQGMFGLDLRRGR